MRILITNNALADRAGSELYVRDLATALLNRGHLPIVYSPVLGEVAQELRKVTIPVVDDLEKIATPPDVIHGHHHLETMTALFRFPTVPAIYMCHGWLPWEEAPPRFPRILRYVAVDYTCRDRLVYEHAIPEERVRVIFNFVDLQRFLPRAPLPSRPQRALVFSNYASEATHLGVVREACARTGLSLDVIGLTSGNSCIHPEEVLGHYDIVFAKGRSALEALSVGPAVVLCDAAGVGPMVTVQELGRLRALNCGIRTLRHPLDPDVLAQEISRYDARDAAEVTRQIRTMVGHDAVVDELVALYRDVLDTYERCPNVDLMSEGVASAAYLRELAPTVKTCYRLQEENRQLATQCTQLQATTRELQAEVEQLRFSTHIQQQTLELRQRALAVAEVEQLRSSTHTQQQMAELRQRALAVATELDRVRHCRTMQMLLRLTGGGDLTPLLSPIFQPLKEGSAVVTPNLRGFRLQPSEDLQRVFHLTYSLTLPSSGLHGLLLAPVCDLPVTRGQLVVDILSASRTIVTQGITPFTQCEEQPLMQVSFPPITERQGGVYWLRVSVRDVDGPVRILEWRKYTWRGLGRLQTRAFCGLLF